MATAARLRGRSDVVLCSVCVVLSLIALVLPAGTRDPIAGAIRSTIAPPLVALQYGAQRWRSAWQSRDRETLAHDSLSIRTVQAQALLSENDQLRKLFGLARRLEDGFVAVEALQTADKADVVTTVVLSAGSNAGIQRYSPVIAPEGLVGTVVTANPTSSIANLYTNPDFRASAMTGDGSAFGIVYPYLDPGVISRNHQYLLELRDVSDRIKLTPGTPIFTSGLGGTTPRGIAIGKIIRPLDAADGLSRSYLIAPAVNPSRISSVLVLTPQRVVQGVGNIWTAAVATDSATRQILAVGDSLARDAAALEDRAKRALIDSVKKTATDSVLRALGYPAGSPPDTTAAKLHRPATDTTSARHPVAPATRPPGDTMSVRRPPVKPPVKPPDTTATIRSVR